MRKATGNYRTYSSLVKLHYCFLSLRWKTCLRQNCGFDSCAQRRTCPWAELDDDDDSGDGGDDGGGDVDVDVWDSPMHCNPGGYIVLTSIWGMGTIKATLRCHAQVSKLVRSGTILTSTDPRTHFASIKVGPWMINHS